MIKRFNVLDAKINFSIKIFFLSLKKKEPMKKPQLFLSIICFLFLLSFVLLISYIALLPRKILASGEPIILPTSQNLLYASVSFVSLAFLLSIIFNIKIYRNDKLESLEPVASLFLLLNFALLGVVIFYMVQTPTGCPDNQKYYPDLNRCMATKDN